MAANKKARILDEILTISGCVTVSYACQIDIGIDISSNQLKEISIATTATFITRCTGRTGSISIAPERF